MKKTAALWALACALLLGGCRMMTFQRDSLSRAECIDIKDAATGEKLGTLEGREELEAFAEALTAEGWQLSEAPENAAREGAFTLYRSGTALSGDQEAERYEICTLFSYREEPCLTIATGLGDISFSISESAASYLHSLVQPPPA